MNNSDGPILLPPLVRGQQIRHGPYLLTVTDEMVAQVQRENDRRRRAWEERQRRQQDEYYGEFKEFDIRQRFISRVFFILAAQLSFTGALCAFFLLNEDAKTFMQKNPLLLLLSLLVFTFTYFAVVCTDCARREVPCNILCLLMLTFSMAYMTAFSCLRYQLDWVILSAGITAAVVITIWMIATCTSFDLTKEVGVMLIISLVGLFAMIFIMIASAFVKIPGAHIAFGLIGALIISMYLFYDVQTLMGGRTLELEPNEYVFGAVMLYVDIILLFKYILMIGGNDG